MISVLAVDDDEVHCYAMQKTLQHLGYDVTCARDGLSTVALASAGSFDAILLDVNLPDINGYEVCRRIRDIAGIRQPAIVFYSAASWSDLSAFLPGNSRQADGFLTYPVQAEHVSAVLGGAMARRRHA